MIHLGPFTITVFERFFHRQSATCYYFLRIRSLIFQVKKWNGALGLRFVCACIYCVKSWKIRASHTFQGESLLFSRKQKQLQRQLLTVRQPETYLEPCQTSKMYFFAEKFLRVLNIYLTTVLFKSRSTRIVSFGHRKKSHSATRSTEVFLPENKTRETSNNIQFNFFF